MQTLLLVLMPINLYINININPPTNASTHTVMVVSINITANSLIWHG